MTTGKKDTKWKPGQSGNPKGKPKGVGSVQKLREEIGEQIPAIINQLLAAAKNGDVQAARLLLERVLPPLKPVEQASPLTLPDGSLTEQGRAVLAAVGAGELPPGQGAQLITAIGSLARVSVIEEIAARLAALEEKHHGND
jgi:hypothetical protein